MIWLFISLKGRLGRAFFWYGAVAILVVFFILGFFVQEAWKFCSGLYDDERAVQSSMALLAWSMFAIGVKRCHDLDRPWWLCLFVLIPVLGLLVWLYLAFFRGTAGPNRFGPDPCPVSDKVFILNMHLRNKSGRIRHEQLSEDQVSRIRGIFLVLYVVYPFYLDEWVDSFRRDKDPEYEIQLWEYTASFFREYCASRTLSHSERQEVFTIILFCLSILREDEIIRIAAVEGISEELALEVIDEYKDGDILPSYIRRNR